MKIQQLILIILTFCFILVGNSQITYLQETFHGGITADGYNQWSTNAPGQFDINIEPGSTIKKAILFTQVVGYPEERIAMFNGTNLVLSGENTLMNTYLLFKNSSTFWDYRTLAIDVTELINPSQLSYSIVPPIQDAVFTEFGAYVEFYLVVLYENTSLPAICANIFVNNTNPQAIQNYILNLLNPINPSNSAALCVNGAHFCDTIEDGSYIFVNGNNIGLAGGDDDNGYAICSALTSSFYYQNNTLFGMGNDVSNTTMNGTDGIANIESHIVSTTSVDVRFDYQSNLAPSTNPVYELFLTYTTSCDTFTVTSPKDTTLCRGATLQLNASGGTPNTNSTSGYEWQPATGLSCTDCPNPVFTADSSMFYTVRVWNTDSCSVVRPLKINVRPQPVWDTITVDSTICGASTGAANLFAFPNNGIVQSWTEVGGATQTTNIFQNLSGGNHTFYFTNTNGCQSADTTIFIPSTKPTVANFTANPISGASPLSVDFVNTSQQATNYEWSVNGINLGNSLPNFVFDSTGNYWVELVAWQNSPFCADTFVLQIIAYDSLVLQIPNVFSPNGDGTNDAYTLTSNVPVSVNYNIVNRWGQTMVAQSVQFGPGKTLLWDATNSPIEITEGTYFYSIEATPTFDNGVIGKTVKLSGFLQLVR